MIDNIISGVKKNKFVLIAEIGVNYYDIAKKMNITPIDAAKFMILSAHNAGIHAVKFQTYKADTLASKYSPYYWDIKEEPTESQYELFKKYDTFSEKEYEDLSLFCDRIGIEFCSTPFDFESSDYLNRMMNVFKISSSDLTNIPFIEHISKKNKPIIISTGASNINEIEDALAAIRRYNSETIILMHCVLEYPTPYEHANLERLVSLRQHFKNVHIGYSDHTKPDSNYNVIKAAYLLGATVIEKHFTVDKLLRGNDHYHAMDAKDALNIINEIQFIDKIRGNNTIECLSTEKKARENARRSIVAAKKIPSGTIITLDMLTYKRPGHGISPANINSIVGNTACIDIMEDVIIQPNMLSKVIFNK